MVLYKLKNILIVLIKKYYNFLIKLTILTWTPVQRKLNTMKNNKYSGKLYLKIFLITAAIGLLAVNCSCSKALKFKSDEKGNLIDAKNDKYYILCSLSIRAASTLPEPYAKAEKGYKVYEIPNMDPAEWLSEKATDAIPFVYREENVAEPELPDFEAVKIHLTQTEEATIYLGFIEDATAISMIINNLTEGNPCDVPSGVADKFTLNFESEKYPGLFYCVQLLYDESGNCYIYDRDKKNCVKAYIDYLNEDLPADTAGSEIEEE